MPADKPDAQTTPLQRFLLAASEHATRLGKPRKGMGSYRDELGGLWKFWRGAWRKVKEKPRGKQH